MMQMKASRWGRLLAGCALATTPLIAGADTAAPMSPLTDIDMLSGQPNIIAGQQMVRVKGRVKNVVVNRDGQVIGLIIDKASMHGSTDVTDAATNTMASGDTLIRIPDQYKMKCVSNSAKGVTQLSGWSWVEAVGYPEAPRVYGTPSFAWRVAATAISVDGRSVGAAGFPKREPRGKALLNFNLFGGNVVDDTAPSNMMGYTVLTP